MENGVSEGEGQGNIRLLLDGPSRSNQGQEAVEQKQTCTAQYHPPHLTSPPAFCCSPWPVSYILVMSKDCDILHLKGKLAVDVINMWSYPTTRHCSRTGRHLSLQTVNIFIFLNISIAHSSQTLQWPRSRASSWTNSCPRDWYNCCKYSGVQQSQLDF